MDQRGESGIRQGRTCDWEELEVRTRGEKREDIRKGREGKGAGERDGPPTFSTLDTPTPSMSVV